MPQNAQARRIETEDDVPVVQEAEPYTKDGRPMTPAEIILKRHARGSWYEWT